MSFMSILDPGPIALRKAGPALIAGSLLIWSGVAGAAQAPDSFSGLAKKVSPAVVNIASTKELRGSGEAMPELPFEFPEGSPFEEFFKQFRERFGDARPGDRHGRRVMGQGSGFIIDPAGYVVTNNHVVDDASEVTVRLDDDSVFSAKVLGTDRLTDLALLKIDAKRPLPSVAFGDSDAAEVGDWVLAVGNPFGLGGTVTAGIISARGRNIAAGPYDDFLQIDAPINRGNSGGPLFSLDGKVIGINTAIFSPNGGSVGIGFAIPSNIAKPVIAQLREQGKVERGWLGVRIQDVTPEIADALNLGAQKGAVVVEVTPDSPAADAGIRQGDVILAFGDRPVEDSRGLARAVAETAAGTETEISVWRGGEKETVSIVPGERPARMASTAPSPERPGGVFRSEALGAGLAALTPELRERFRVPDEVTGVLVLDVENAADTALGLRAGDVIQKVAESAVETPAQVDALVREAKEADAKAVLMLISRRGQDLFLGLKLGTA